MSFEDLHRPLGRAGFKGAVKWIVSISGVLLILQQFFGGWMVHYFGLTPYSVLHHYWVWQIVTYLFLHGGLFHWLFNMFVLWMFGRELEVRWGTAAFLTYFFLTGFGAAVCVLLIAPNSMAPTIGSSGAIFGLLTAFAMVFPEAVMYLYFVIPVKAWQAAVLFGFVEFFASLSGGASAVSSLAHLGGMGTGYVYLRWGWQIGEWIRRPLAPLQDRLDTWRKKQVFKKKKAMEFYEVTDDLVTEVDRILDKILKQGVDSLSPRERELMDRYAKLKK